MRPTLLDHLQELDPDRVERLLTLRPDVLRGAPVRDMTDLAERLTQPTSVMSAVLELPEPHLRTLEALVAAGLGASVDRASELLVADDPDAHRDVVLHVVQWLAGLALVWPDELDGSLESGRLVVNPGALDVIMAPFGFARPGVVVLEPVAADTLKGILRTWGEPVPTRKAELVEAVLEHLADPAWVRRLVGSAPADVTDVLVSVAREAFQRSHRVADDDSFDGPGVLARSREAADWAVRHGLALRPWGIYGYEVEMPTEVVAALLGPQERFAFSPQAPPLPSLPVTQAQVRRSSAAAIAEVMASAMTLLELVDRAPLTALKSGGVGARELARVAKVLRATPADVRLTLELAQQLGLVVDTDQNLVTTTETFDAWRRGNPAQRAADVLCVWWDSPIVPTIDRDADGRSLGALQRAYDPPGGSLVRSTLIDVASSVGESRAVSGLEPLAAVLAWRAPLLLGGPVNEAISRTWLEAQRLGVVADGAVSEVGAALVSRDQAELLRALGAALPAVQSSALFGSDLTVVVSGTPDPSLVDLLDAVADRESSGMASTWRLTAGSVRRALDQGLVADDLLTRMRAASVAPLPQPVEYLVADVARRYGRVGVRPAGAVLTSPDEPLLAEISVHRALRSLGLRLVAPMVLTSAATPTQVIDALRAAGYLPRELDGAGDAVITPRRRPLGADADGPSFQRPVVRPVVGPPFRPRETEGARGVAERMFLTGDDAPVFDESHPADYIERITRAARRLSPSEVLQLAYALDQDRPVRIRYRAAGGSETDRVVSELHLAGNSLYGWCHLRDDERIFSLDGVLSVHAV